MYVFFLIKKAIHIHCRALGKYGKHIVKMFPMKILIKRA